MILGIPKGRQPSVSRRSKAGSTAATCHLNDIKQETRSHIRAFWSEESDAAGRSDLGIFTYMKPLSKFSLAIPTIELRQY